MQFARKVALNGDQQTCKKAKGRNIGNSDTWTRKKIQHEPTVHFPRWPVLSPAQAALVVFLGLFGRLCWQVRSPGWRSRHLTGTIARISVATKGIGRAEAIESLKLQRIWKAGHRCTLKFWATRRYDAPLANHRGPQEAFSRVQHALYL